MAPGTIAPAPPARNTAAEAVGPDDVRRLTGILLDRLRTLEEGTAEYRYVRGTLIELNLPLVRAVAARRDTRPDPDPASEQAAERLEEVVQVGCIGLIRAIDRFELARETEFAAFAAPYVRGEIKRFLRGAGGDAYAAHPLPHRCEDGGLESVEELAALHPLVAALRPRDRYILLLRFGSELTQSQIGERLGVSQMQVSRLLSRILAHLRAGMLAQDQGPDHGPLSPRIR